MNMVIYILLMHRILQKDSGTFALRETKKASPPEEFSLNCRNEIYVTWNQALLFDADAWNARLVRLVHVGCFLPRCQSSRNQRWAEKVHAALSICLAPRFLIFDTQTPTSACLKVALRQSF